MTPTLEEAETHVRNSNIDEHTMEILAAMLVSKMDEWHLVADQKTSESIWVILTEAARRGKISEKLGDTEVAKRLERVFEKIRPKLEAQLRTIQWNYDEIIDFEVRVSKVNKSSLFVDPTAQRTVVHLKVLPTGSTEVKTLVVDFDESQLEEFIWKLQEATTMRERIQMRVEDG
ncbi:unnamed protein product [Caenorhabditis sp. 36 PRJEB53466]|nr:unnamed protein product [Caenorhabditis sp. 36 PRJEB53466]